MSVVSVPESVAQKREGEGVKRSEPPQKVLCTLLICIHGWGEGVRGQTILENKFCVRN